jgi:hypothetical protein
MDVERIFTNLREWTRGLTDKQSTLLSKLMDAKDSKGFVGIQVNDVLELQLQMLRSDEDTDRLNQVKSATDHLDPVASDIEFI